MTHDSHGPHHFHKRQRIHQKHEPYPHPDKWKKLMDKLIYIVGVIGPVMTIPQIFKIWIHKNASGVSAASWTAYLICSIFWVIYGKMHKEKPVIITYSIWIVLDIFIIIGTIIYG